MVEAITVPAKPNDKTLEAEAAAQDAAAAAAAKAAEDAAKLAGEGEGERPAWLPEKFKTPEEMAASYSALEAKLGEGNEDATKEADKAAADAVKSAGLDMDALNAEYAEKGELTEDSYKALEAAGISKEIVAQYIAGQEAAVAQATETLLAPVGGQEGYDAMLGWAADNLSEAEIDTYNSLIESGDQNQMKMAVENLHNKFSADQSNEPGRQLAGKGSDTGLSKYESTADLMKDMQNPEYRTNPAFRAKVEAKLGRSAIM